MDAGAPTLDTPKILEGGAGAYLGLDYKGLSLMASFTGYADAVFAGISGPARWRRGFADLGYSFKPRDWWEISFHATYTRNTLDASSFVAASIARDSNELLLEWTNNVQPTNRDRSTFGALYNHIEGQEYFLGVTPAEVICDGARPGGAAYAQIDHSLLDSVTLIGGFQLNKVENITLGFVPRVGVIWSPNSRINVKALYSEAFRAPSLDETMQIWLGDQNLKPEKVATIDVGVHYQANRIDAGISYFRSHQTDSIGLDYSLTSPIYRNLGEAIFHGVEVEGRYYFTKNFLLLGSASYQHNVDGSGDQNVTPIPNFGAKPGLSYKTKRWTGSLFDIYEGHLSPRFTNVLNPPTGAYHLLAAHTRFNVSKQQGNKPGLAFIARGENLANKQLWLPEWSDNPADTMPVNRGRTVYIGLEISWWKD